MPESDLLVTIQATSKTLNKVLAGYKTLAKCLERLDSPKSLERQDYVYDALDALKNSDLNSIGCADQQRLMMHGLTEKLHSLRANAHHILINGLNQGIDKPEHLKIISDNPLVVYLHPLTLEVNFEQSKATLLYAHETLQNTSLDPDEIFKTHAELLDVFRASRIDSARFWDACYMAYRMVLLKNGLANEARIDIIELMPALSWLWPVPVKKINPFPKYLLAYQLQKLRADKMLENHGLRIDLGTATGGSTKNKANVLFIPSGISEGQYYLSICFRRV